MYPAHAYCLLLTLTTVHLNQVVTQLMKFLEIDIDYVSAEAILAMRNLLRKYPERRGPVLPTLARLLRGENEPAGKAAVLWIVGEWGEEVPLAPYLVEQCAVARLVDVADHQPCPRRRLPPP